MVPVEAMYLTMISSLTSAFLHCVYIIYVHSFVHTYIHTYINIDTHMVLDEHLQEFNTIHLAHHQKPYTDKFSLQNNVQTRIIIVKDQIIVSYKL